MNSNHAEIISLLIDLEAMMRQRGMWSETPPSDDAFESEMPFFVDRMNFLEWLQFVFLVRIRDMVENAESLPDTCSIAPMAEIHFGEAGIQAGQVIALLAQIDQAITAA